MLSQFAQDFIYKGVAYLENKGARFQLRTACDVARVIISRAIGWDARKKDITQALADKAINCRLKELKLQSQMLIDDFIESSFVVCCLALYYFYYSACSPEILTSGNYGL